MARSGGNSRIEHYAVSASSMTSCATGGGCSSNSRCSSCTRSLMRWMTNVGFVSPCRSKG